MNRHQRRAEAKRQIKILRKVKNNLERQAMAIEPAGMSDDVIPMIVESMKAMQPSKENMILAWQEINLAITRGTLIPSSMVQA